MQGELSMIDPTNATDADPKIQISLGKNVRAGKVKTKEAGWRQFVDRFREPLRSELTAAQFAALEQADQAALKSEPGYYVGATFTGGRRRRDEIDKRTLLTLDLDHCPRDFDPQLDLALPDDATFLVHTTRTHNPSSGVVKWRLIVPLAQPIDADHYEPLARMLAHRAGILDMLDPTCYRPAQLMYWPSAHADGEYEVFCTSDEVGELEPLPLLDPATLLGPIDLDAPDSWPRGVHDKQAPSLNKNKLDDPRNKPGFIGAYCRAYTVYDVLERVIPGVYEETAHIDRYRYHGSTGNDGAEVYDNGLFFFSHHDSDPAGNGHSHNAFDLARAHLYLHLDEGAGDCAPSDLPSFKAMMAHAEGDELVQALIAEEEDDLFDVEPEYTDSGEPIVDETDELLARSLADFDGVELPQTEFLLYPYIPKERYTMLSGPGGVGKTSFAIQLGLEVASGVPVLHDREARAEGKTSAPPLKPAPVLLVSSEDHTNVCVNRARRVLSSPLYADPEDPDFWAGDGPDTGRPAEMTPMARQRAKRNFHIIDAARSKRAPNFCTISRQYGSTPTLKPTEFFKQVLRAVDEHGIKLLIIDNLGAIFPGSINDDETLRPFLHRVLLHELSVRRGCIPLLIHHNNKAGARTGGPGEYAGSQYLASSAASLIQIGVSKEDAEVKELHHTKSNYARQAPPLDLRYRDGALCTSQSGSQIGAHILDAVASLNRAGQSLRWRVGSSSVYNAAKVVHDHTRSSAWRGPVVPKHEAENLIPHMIEKGSLVEAYVHSGDPNRRGKSARHVELFTPASLPHDAEELGVFDDWDGTIDSDD